LTGMGRAQGIFYISAFQGKVLNIQCYVYLVKQAEIAKQNFTRSIFIAGRCYCYYYFYPYIYYYYYYYFYSYIYYLFYCI